MLFDIKWKQSRSLKLKAQTITIERINGGKRFPVFEKEVDNKTNKIPGVHLEAGFDHILTVVSNFEEGKAQKTELNFEIPAEEEGATELNVSMSKGDTAPKDVPPPRKSRFTKSKDKEED